MAEGAPRTAHRKVNSERDGGGRRLSERHLTCANQWALGRGPRGRVPVGPSGSRVSRCHVQVPPDGRARVRSTYNGPDMGHLPALLPFEAPPVSDVDERRDLSSRTGWESKRCRARSRYETTEGFLFVYTFRFTHTKYILALRQRLHLRLRSYSAAFRCCAWATSGCRAPPPRPCDRRGSGLCFACCRLPHLCLAANETHAQVRSCM